MLHATQPMPSSEHFEIQKLAEGVYAAIAKEFGAAFSNSGIIDLGDLTLVFDTFETPKAAEDLRAAAQSLTGRLPDYVINSHNHADHWFGNQAFAGQATIISTHKTRDLMPVYLEELKTLKQNPSELSTSLEENRRLLDTETDPQKRAAIQGYVARLKHSLKSLPVLELILPNQTFGEKIVFYGTAAVGRAAGVGQRPYLRRLLPGSSRRKYRFPGRPGFLQTPALYGRLRFYGLEEHPRRNQPI